MGAFAHSGQPLSPNNLWAAWNLEPSLLIPLALSVLIYAWGMSRVWRRAGAGRGIGVRQLAMFSGAILAMLAALTGPLDALSGVLFSAHMVQHLILILVAAPLLVLSDFPLALLWALPRDWAQALAYRLNQSPVLSRAWPILSTPVSAWLWFAIALWGWHASALFQAAVQDERIHAFEHLALLLTAILLWWVLFKQTGPRRVRYGMAVPYLFATALQSGILGALMTFTTEPWYSYYTPLVKAWGLTALQDQQLAGLIMWMPGGTVFSLLTIGYFGAWLRALEQ